MEKIPNTNPDIGSEVPPSYPGSTAYQTPVIPEPVSYPSTFASELPPSYLSSSSAISQGKGTTQHTTVAVVTSQPSRVTRSFATSDQNSAADHVLYLSVCWCVICFICGCPFTICCFVPAILLALKVKYCTYICIYNIFLVFCSWFIRIFINAGERVCFKW